VHTSGALPLAALGGVAERTGVLYPLQTFSDDRAVDWSEVPLLIEGSEATTTELLTALAARLSEHVHPVRSEQRRQLHLAAVFACNFTNHLLLIADEVMRGVDLDPTLLHPLVRETFEKALTIGPEAAQTGPARRNDVGTMRWHEASLAARPELLELYRTLSERIQKNEGLR
ncbi:MAG: DUF2520 domain-containing protein, partial [Catalinimonas sp.]